MISRTSTRDLISFHSPGTHALCDWKANAGFWIIGCPIKTDISEETPTIVYPGDLKPLMFRNNSSTL